jgi:large subunit ribosomal protein L4
MKGKSVGSLDLSEAVFAAPLRRDLLHQAVLRHLANRRGGNADTKTRAEVRGGGRKPWRQKGTGRSRHGSFRSPIWRKGGVVWGPHPRKYTQALPRKMRRLALASALSTKVANSALLALDKLALDEFKTKNFVAVLEALKLSDKALLEAAASNGHSQQLLSTRHKNRVATHKALVVINERDEKVLVSAANVPNVKVVTPSEINVYDVLKYRRIVITKDAIAAIEEALK